MIKIALIIFFFKNNNALFFRIYPELSKNQFNNFKVDHCMVQSWLLVQIHLCQLCIQQFAITHQDGQIYRIQQHCRVWSFQFLGWLLLFLFHDDLGDQFAYSWLKRNKMYSVVRKFWKIWLVLIFRVRNTPFEWNYALL